MYQSRHQSSANGPPLRTLTADADVARWLVDGGDERLRLDALGRNRYGVGPMPETGGLSFGSSTASTISAGAFEAARARLEAIRGCASPRAAYHAGAAEIRARLAGLCALAPSAADDIILAASGTDLHLIAADLARGDGSRQLVSVMAEPGETGRGVANALRSRRYATASPYGPAASVDAPLSEAPAAGLLAVPLREACGAPRDAATVDADFEAAVGKAVATRGAVLLIMVDVSKTGLAAPSAQCAVRLKARHGAALTVMVDACQFRLSAESLGDYLAAGFLVAVTGSKFVGGPPFSGALLLPPSEAAHLHRAPISPALGDYCARADWPAGFIARSVLPDVQSFGLLLRWEAALHELEAFRRIPSERLHAALEQVAAVVEARLATRAFEALPVPRIDRSGRAGWDATPTLFPFLVHGAQGLLPAARTQALYQALSDERVLLGQPVPVGRRGGQPASALRLAISARQLVEATHGPDAAQALVARIEETFDFVAARAAALG
ncbi:MAG TPA: hypothetical protein VJS38_02700 [Phenylobacterium sp.]|uniref:hypothetical protein n=1 Tax=Phenylobacterium sp. TaxID=1871053 RepID=UPI002B487F56|nr:hypothetical protein [Phenylobacterium sp.]HKR87059.1 hypothetical protein [Phenylobacterium sp.]